MLFDQTAPSSAYWTPPKVAKGWDKTRLALFGYGADGQQNGWGKLSSWIPGLGIGLNVAAQKDAKKEGLDEVSTNIGQDLDNRLQKLQTLVAVGQTAASAATGNIAGVASGVQGITQGLSGTIQAQDKNQGLMGQQYYAKYADGGKPQPGPGTRRMTREELAKAGLSDKQINDYLGSGNSAPASTPRKGATRSVGATYVRPRTAEERTMDAAMSGRQFAMDWFNNRPAAKDADVNFDAIPKPTLFTGDFKQSGEYLGVFGPVGEGGTIQIARNPEDSSPMSVQQRLAAIKSTSAHETAHAFQHMLKPKVQYAPPAPTAADRLREQLLDIPKKAIEAFGLVSPNKILRHGQVRVDEALAKNQLPTIYGPDPIKESLKLIDATPKRSTNNNAYLRSAEEIHARIMEWRQQTGTSPTEQITPELYYQRKKQLERSGRQGQGVSELYRTVDDENLIKLLDKTVGTQSVQDNDLFRAKEGGKITIYDKHDDTEDIHMIDKATGEKIGEMRYGERIFDQQATIKMEELADKKDDHALGRFLRRELATHADRKGMQTFAGGGKLLKTGLTSQIPIPAALKAQVVSPPTTQSSQSTKTDWFGLAGDGVRALTSAIGAAQELPTRPVNPNLLQMQRELADKQNEGLSAAERINLLRQKAATQAYEVQAIRDTAGGGGSAAAVLGATNKADLRANQMGVEIEQADAAQKAQNKQNYYNDLQTTQAQSDQLYAQQYNNALNTRNSFATALGANLQNMADRNQYNQSYGEGSPYYNLMLQMMKRTGKTQSYADAPVTAGVLAKQV